MNESTRNVTFEVSQKVAVRYYTAVRHSPYYVLLLTLIDTNIIPEVTPTNYRKSKLEFSCRAL